MCDLKIASIPQEDPLQRTGKCFLTLFEAKCLYQGWKGSGRGSDQAPRRELSQARNHAPLPPTLLTTLCRITRCSRTRKKEVRQGQLEVQLHSVFGCKWVL
ncbi:hypothetical protein M404DRAFT_991799 [Pisolithus tinctorius Marx 270]|uniref:Uncharacterized protein n=1 Tax=Pisolithus tinctorius Marx 270 TaxID=870435 RepID=A0A0C3PZ67_PISTI|nr:hypothetical protein M404DRAFT_991799 [Pisolithus tinctorius Marx 270]